MLIKSASKSALSKNIATEMHAGKSQKQAVAIAYAQKSAAKKGYSKDVVSMAMKMKGKHG